LIIPQKCSHAHTTFWLASNSVADPSQCHLHLLFHSSADQQDYVVKDLSWHPGVDLLIWCRHIQFAFTWYLRKSHVCTISTFQLRTVPSSHFKWTCPSQPHGLCSPSSLLRDQTGKTMQHLLLPQTASFIAIKQNRMSHPLSKKLSRVSRKLYSCDMTFS